MKKIIALTFIGFLTFSVTAHAGDVWDMSESPVYKEKAAGMFGRGLLNVATSFIDMPVQLVAGASTADNPFLGTVGGFASGAACTVLRAGSGVIDVASFWVPGFHGVPVSRSYENCLDFSGGQEETVPSLPTSKYTPPPAPQIFKKAEPASSAAPFQPTDQDSRMKYVKK